MKTNGKHWFVSVILLTAFGCASPEESSEPPVVIDTVEEPMEMAETPETPEVNEPVDLGPLPKFVGTETLRDFNPRPDVVEVKLNASQRPVTLAEDFTLDMYTFNGSIPGPLIEAEVGDTVIVHFTNFPGQRPRAYRGRLGSGPRMG